MKFLFDFATMSTADKNTFKCFKFDNLLDMKSKKSK